MAARFVSDEAVAIAHLYRQVVNLVREKENSLDRPTRHAAIEVLLDGMREMEEAMRRPTVRGHSPNIRLPEVDKRSSLNSILRRLKYQKRAACGLADLSHNGPAANEDETVALNQVKQTLLQIFEYYSNTVSESTPDSS